MSKLAESLRAFWRGEGGGREVLAIGYPLILGHLSAAVWTFFNRLFLTWFSPAAVAGATAASFSTYALLSLFIGTGEFLTVFVAQYLGAGRRDRVGPTMAQGLWFSAAAGVLVASLAPLARPFFALAHNAPDVFQNEVAFAELFLRGAFPMILMPTLSTFWSGRGRTRVVLAVNAFSWVLNVLLDWLLIFGRAGFPRMGVRGAALAVVVSQSAGAAIFLALLLAPRNRAAFGTLSGWRLDPKTFWRLLRFGLPTGLATSLEILAFAIFMLIVGRIGTDELAASSVAFSLNMLVFMPMLGLAVGVSALVGRSMGAGRPDVAQRATWSAFWMSLAYMLFWGLLYVGAPGVLLSPYAADADPASFARLSATATALLRFIAVYSIFDMMNVIFAGGLRGAGDTTFPLLATLALAVFTLLLPTYLFTVVLGHGVFVAWTAASAYVWILGVLMLLRFRAGGWKRLSVVEPRVVAP